MNKETAVRFRHVIFTWLNLRIILLPLDCCSPRYDSRRALGYFFACFVRILARVTGLGLRIRAYDACAKTVWIAGLHETNRIEHVRFISCGGKWPSHNHVNTQYFRDSNGIAIIIKILYRKISIILLTKQKKVWHRLNTDDTKFKPWQRGQHQEIWNPPIGGALYINQSQEFRYGDSLLSLLILSVGGGRKGWG